MEGDAASHTAGTDAGHQEFAGAVVHLGGSPADQPQSIVPLGVGLGEFPLQKFHLSGQLLDRQTAIQKQLTDDFADDLVFVDGFGGVHVRL